MTRSLHRTAQLGDIVAAAFDRASDYSADPAQVSRLATQAVMHMLQRPGNMALLNQRQRPTRTSPLCGEVS